VPNAVWIEFMPFGEMVATMAKVDNVVCHAGVGTIMTALQAGHTPVVVPRRAHHGEHVDDHQLDIANRLAERGLIRCVTNEIDLAPLLMPRNENGDRPIGKGSAALRLAVADAVAAGSNRRNLLSIARHRRGHE
jgi:UDP-N-acetylglucosamine--N-acetylmuramyl-(pentapeptide) pyrophosphoryl-undecaprenol N-acetylglucosamine transferase